MILVTGITGFVGSNLRAVLEKTGQAFISLSRRESSVAGPNELTYQKFFERTGFKADHYIHLAGKAHDLKKTSSEAEYFEVNYELTRKLYDRFLADAQSKAFIFMSSVKSAKDQVEGQLKEEASCTPVTAYGKSKRMAEEYILANLPSNKKVYILRPCMIHGPNNKGNLNLLYQFVKKGIPYPLAAFENRRSFSSIDNLIFIFERLLTDPSIPGGVYNVADDEPLSTKNVIEIMGEAGKKKSKLWNISPGLIRSVAKFGDRLKLPLNSERLQKLTEDYVVSNEKIKKALGVDCLPVTSREGLLRTIRSFE